MRDKWIDISVSLRSGMVTWPGDPPVSLERYASIDRGDEANISSVAMCLHTGTHMDAPLHYFSRGAAIDQLPLSATLGRARVIAIRSRNAIEPDELRANGIRRGERILLKTRNSSRCWKASGFCKDYVYLSRAGAEFLAARGITLVGIDYLSIGSFESGEDTHRVLLGAGVWIVEGLDLSKAQPGTYDMVCLPLKVAGADGAPARVVLRRR